VIWVFKQARQGSTERTMVGITKVECH